MFSKKSFVFNKSILCSQKSLLYSKKVFYVIKLKTLFCSENESILSPEFSLFASSA